MTAMRIFLSHSSADKKAAKQVVEALRGADADVWYDENNLGPGALLDEISREVRARPIFVVLLSEQAIASEWVREECKWAHSLWMTFKDSEGRVILPVVVAPLAPDSLENGMLYLSGFKRIEGPQRTPLPVAAMIGETLRLLTLTPAGQPPVVFTPQPAEPVTDLLIQGGALVAQRRLAEALPFFQRATEREPHNAANWLITGWTLNALNRPIEALKTLNQAISLDPGLHTAWVAKGLTLEDLKHHDQALAAFNSALELAPDDASAWGAQGITLMSLERYVEAEAAFSRALELGLDDQALRNARAYALLYQHRYLDALRARWSKR